jgi:hypothetical protein
MKIEIDVCDLILAECEAAIDLWTRCALTKPWNDPAGQRHPVPVWLLTNLWNEFNANAGTEFHSDDGLVPFHSALRGPCSEVEAGFDTEIADNLTATASYQNSSEGGVRSFSGNIRVRFNQ